MVCACTMRKKVQEGTMYQHRFLPVTYRNRCPQHAYMSSTQASLHQQIL